MQYGSFDCVGIVAWCHMPSTQDMMNKTRRVADLEYVYCVDDEHAGAKLVNRRIKKYKLDMLESSYIVFVVKPIPLLPR